MPYLLINKPAGVTSHDVVDRVRKVTGERTVGHAGTLDPFATGLLIIGVGRDSTKHLDKFLGLPKTYEAIVRIGESSTTLDPEGEIVNVSIGNRVLEIGSEEVTAAMRSLTGDLLQIPPMHSAIKIGGKKLYELARKGIEIDRPPRPVTVTRFALQPDYSLPTTNYSLPFNLPVIIDCSSGTYIRSLARDLGEALGTKAYLTALTRTAIGTFQLADAANLTDLNPENWATLAKNLAA
jgi:tRNA pseudouridine55 synthase